MKTERNIYCKIRKKERSGTRRKKKRSKKETQREREGLYSRVSKEENNYFGMKEKQPQLYTVFNWTVTIYSNMKLTTNIKLEIAADIEENIKNEEMCI